MCRVICGSDTDAVIEITISRLLMNGFTKYEIGVIVIVEQIFATWR